jgi:tetrahydromethanopterin S-methyltransferase subunit G
VPELLHETPDVDALGGDQTEVERRLQPAADEDRAADGARQRSVDVGFGSDGPRILTIRPSALSKVTNLARRRYRDFAIDAPRATSCLQASAIMELMRESWTDERLDDLNERVDRRFDEVDQRFDEVDRRFDEVDRRFDSVNERFGRLEGEIRELRGDVKAEFALVHQRFDALHRTMVQFCGLMFATVGGLFATAVGLFATQL